MWPHAATYSRECLCVQQIISCLKHSACVCLYPPSLPFCLCYMSAGVTHSCRRKPSSVLPVLCLRLVSVSRAVILFFSLFFFFFFFFRKANYSTVVWNKIRGIQSGKTVTLFFFFSSLSLLKRLGAFEKPDSAVTICEMSVCVGVRECARACICGLSLSYPCSPERGAAASLHRRKREGGREGEGETIDGNNERGRGRQTKNRRRERERQSDSIGSRGWWLPWDATSGWRRARERDGGREGGREGGSHVRSHVSGREKKKVGSGCRVRDWREAESAQSMRRQGRGCAYVTACSG